MRTELNLIANEKGEFRGSSANISGEGFAGMYFTTKADSEEQFKDWVKSVKESPEGLDLKAYKELAKPTQNVAPAVYQLKDENLFNQVCDEVYASSKCSTYIRNDRYVWQFNAGCFPA